MKSINLIVALLVCLITNLKAQEFKCKVYVLGEQIQGVDPKVFKTLEQGISDFINNRKWTNDLFDTKEKIECVMTFTLSKQIAGEEGGFSGRVSIQSKRPVFNSNYTSTLVNYIDKDVQFRYIQFQTIDFSDNRVAGNDALASNLPAIIAYYCYMMLGLDYDSFALKGGTEFFNKALNIVNNAPESKFVSGWGATEGQRNRFWLVDQMMNVRFVNIREIQYKFHRLGLDLLSTDPDLARTNINTIFPLLQTTNAENPSSILLQFWFNAKGEEIINFLQRASTGDKQKFVPILAPMDVSNAAKYGELLK